MATSFSSILLRLSNFRSPLLQAIVPCASAALAIQAAAAVPSIAFGTERFYDLSGSLTFVAVGALSLYLPALRARALATLTTGGALRDKLAPLPTIRQLLATLGGGAGGFKAGDVGARDWRQVVVTGMVLTWAIRLGSHLFSRVMSHGSDSRFDSIRNNPPKFAFAFFMQAAWVTLELLPVIALNAVPATTVLAAASSSALTKVLAPLGLALWIAGFAFESIADRQKARWQREKREKIHDEEFLTKGLFSLCRYPNYFGEITMWTGLATTAAGVLASRPVQTAVGLSGGLPGALTTTALAFVSPAFISFLLLKLSGVPMSEPKYDKKFGHRKDYQEWRNNTPRLIPKIW